MTFATTFLCLSLMISTTLAGEPARRRISQAVPNPPAETIPTVPPTLPPLPDGVTQLDYDEFFKTPVGKEGLELTDKLKSLDGKQVRIVGFMIQEDQDAHEGESAGVVPGRFMIAPRPVKVSYAHYGLSDDLPPQTVFVTTPDFAGKVVPYSPQGLLLIGTLSVGNVQEPEGRVSVVRLRLDTSTSVANTASPDKTNLQISNAQKNQPAHQH